MGGFSKPAHRRAIPAVKGLTREEMVECLVSPLREPSEFLAAFEELEKVAWYLHHTAEGRFYFDRQENLTKLLESLAQDAPENQIDDLIRHRLRDMFKAARKTAYEEALPLPRLDEVADRARRGPRRLEFRARESCAGGPDTRGVFAGHRGGSSPCRA